MRGIDPLDVRGCGGGLRILGTRITDTVSGPGATCIIFSMGKGALIGGIGRSTGFSFSMFESIMARAETILPSLDVGKNSRDAAKIFCSSDHALGVRISLGTSVRGGCCFFRMLGPGTGPDPSSGVAAPRDITFDKAKPL